MKDERPGILDDERVPPEARAFMEQPSLGLRLFYRCMDVAVIPLRIYVWLIVVWQDFLQPGATTVVSWLLSRYPGRKGRK